MKKMNFILIAFIAMCMVSCGDPIMPEQISVNPNPLEVVGNKVTVQMTGTFPEKAFYRNAVLTVTPVLKYDSIEVLAESVTYVGQRIKENGKVVNYKTGGTYNQTAIFDYVDGMEQCELYLRFEARRNKKIYDVPDLKIADGLIATVKLVDVSTLQPVIIPDKYQQIIQEMHEADIQFLIQQSKLRQSETETEVMKALLSLVDSTKKDSTVVVSNMQVTGYASPEGGLELNTELANARTINTVKFLSKYMQVRDTAFMTDMTPEDWEGFQHTVENSDMQDKELILNVLRMYDDPAEREEQIKNLSVVYQELATNVLPALRRSQIMFTVDFYGKTDEELVAAFESDSVEMTVEEVLHCATLLENKSDAYEYATAAFPNDYRGWNNLGAVYFQEGRVDDAMKCYEKALSINNNEDTYYNAALVALANKDMTSAEYYIGKAAGTSGDLQTAVGTYYTMTGNYSKAKETYGNSVSNNAALQQLLNEDYVGARQTLQSVKNPNDKTYYLLAVVSARTNNQDELYANLNKAIQLNNEMKVKAQKDIEFTKYQDDERFQTIVY